MAIRLTKLVSDVDIDGKAGRTGSFEVIVDGKLAHSKLATGKFPDWDKFVKLIAAYDEDDGVAAKAGWADVPEGK